MAKREMGPGELAMQARKRYQRRLYIGLIIFAAVIGSMIGAFDRHPHEGGPSLSHITGLQLSPAIAIIGAIGLMIGLVGLPLYMFRTIDELAARRNLRGLAAGSMAVLGGYPAWFVLSAGGLAPEPTALGLFLLGYGVSLVTFIILKWRD
ncbi:MAG: hypothetical protein K2X59_12475 [Sphingomonas sp.]|nr:hypothetical protein [Sphingomonas sp.]